MNYIKLLMLSIVVLSFSSCKDQSETTEAVLANTKIEIVSPAFMQSINEDDTIRLRANITSNVQLHEYLVQIRDVVKDEIVYKYEGHSHDKSVFINLPAFLDVSKDSEMQLIITVLDHNSNKTVNQVAFRVINTVNAARPKITLLSPLKNEVNDGDMLRINGWVKHVSALKYIEISMLQNNDEVLKKIYTTQTDSFFFDLPYTISSAETASFELNVTATDSNNNTSVLTQRFHKH